MSKDSTKAASNILLGSEWHDSIEACVRSEIRGFIESMLETELATALGRARYARARAPERLPEASESGPEEADAAVAQRLFGHRNGHRDRELMGTLGRRRYQFHAHDWRLLRAGQRSGRARRFPRIAGARRRWKR
jgi:hypothetical protein